MDKILRPIAGRKSAAHRFTQGQTPGQGTIRVLLSHPVHIARYLDAALCRGLAQYSRIGQGCAMPVFFQQKGRGPLVARHILTRGQGLHAFVPQIPLNFQPVGRKTDVDGILHFSVMVDVVHLGRRRQQVQVEVGVAAQERVIGPGDLRETRCQRKLTLGPLDALADAPAAEIRMHARHMGPEADAFPFPAHKGECEGDQAIFMVTANDQATVVDEGNHQSRRSRIERRQLPDSQLQLNQRLEISHLLQQTELHFFSRRHRSSPFCFAYDCTLFHAIVWKSPFALQTDCGAGKEYRIRYLATHPRLITLLSVLLSVGILWLALRGIELERLWQVIRDADWRWVLISVLLNLCALTVRGLRWRSLLDGKITTWRAIHAMNITNMLNQLPLRAGEVARSFLARQDGVRLLTAATLVALERLLDLLLIILVLSWALSRLPTHHYYMQDTATLIGGAVLLFFVFAWWITRQPNKTNEVQPSWLQIRRLSRIPMMRSLMRFFFRILTPIFEGLQAIQNRRLVLITSGWTLLGWFFSFATFAALMPALHLQEENIILVCALTLTLSSLGVAAPLTVASVGPYEAMVVLGGTLAGLNEEAALVFALLAHGTSLALYAVLGSIGAAVLGISIRDVLHSAHTNEAIHRDTPIRES